MYKVILGSIEILHELVQLIQQLDDDSYRCPPQPLFNSPIGSHVRHILDIYQALILEQHNLIDYDLRRRGNDVETKRVAALKELIEIENWLMALKEEQFSEVKIVKTEVCLSQQESMNFTSTLGRELCFASSHVTHHLALIVAIARSMNIQVNGQLGIAPATATFLRQQAAK
ncbi:MAG: DinB family protein [Oleispira sp.]